MSTGRSPSQTIGPFFGFALAWADGPFAAPAGIPGGIWLRGRLLDGAGQPVPDGLVETWQVGAAGVRGFGRSATDGDGRYAIHTVKPAAQREGEAVHAPHVAVSLFARGLLRRAVTRIYFADEDEANRVDPVLALVDEPARRATLIAAREADGYRLDFWLQGDAETVFFDV